MRVARFVPLAKEHLKIPTASSSWQATKTDTAINPIPDFHAAEAAYASKSTPQLLRAALSFGLCRLPWLVRHAETLLSTSRRLLGDGATDWFLRQTLYGHFVPGKDEQRVQPAVQSLQHAGVRALLDHASEDDDVYTDRGDQSTDESKYDRSTELFRRCIQSVADLEHGCASIKITALCDPKLLERMGTVLMEARAVFRQSDVDGDGYLSLAETKDVLSLLLGGDDTHLDATVDAMLAATPDKQRMDYITWTSFLNPRFLLSSDTFAIERLHQRAESLATEAARSSTMRLLIDAEQLRYQPAIEYLVWWLQRSFNNTQCTSRPLIFNTYQCYLKDAESRLALDIRRAEQLGYHLGAKIVRGAYMESERALATSRGEPSPIHETSQATHDCYNRAVESALHYAQRHSSERRTEIILGTHNQESVEKAITVMNALGIDRRDPTISFAQLFAMKDYLTFSLGKHGYAAYKLIPYGEVNTVIPYLVRRAQENSSISVGAGLELHLIIKELTRRLLPLG